jgi:hypothetical protein
LGLPGQTIVALVDARVEQGVGGHAAVLVAAAFLNNQVGTTKDFRRTELCGLKVDLFHGRDHVEDRM